MRLTYFFFVITVLLACLACITDNPLTSRDTSSVTLNINLPRGEGIPDTGTGLAKAMAITSVTVTVTADDMKDIEESLDISEETASGTLEVPRGEDRIFTVECWDANDILQYSGFDTTDILEKSETVTITTEGHYPSASTLTITSFDATSVSLSWTVNSDLDFATYELVGANTKEALYHSSARKSIATIIDQNTTTYTDYLGSSIITYYYMIIVWDTEGLGNCSLPECLGVQKFSNKGPWSIPDSEYGSLFFVNKNFAPTGSVVANVEYRLRIIDTGDPNTFWCGDYEIYISSSIFVGTGPDDLVYDNLGGRTDGGYDDDEEDDSDIYLNWRSTSYFDGEDASQYWGVHIVDNLSANSGQLDYLELIIRYVAPPGCPGVITLRVPANAAGEGVTLTGSHPSGDSQGSIEPISTGFDKVKFSTER